MESAESADATREFDQEFIIDSFTSPPLEAARQWRRAKHKRGRPVQGKGAEVISVSIEKSLLELSDQLAKKLGISRASLISRGLRAVLAAEGIR